MDLVSVQYGRWEVECLPADGARLHALRFAGHDLLTGPPRRFQPPVQDHGEYETRPVYGYDDCFPSVDPSDLPGHPGVRIRDHGELCWLPWSVTRDAHRLTCTTHTTARPTVQFTRTLIPADTALKWRFDVLNEGPASLPFLHVMHALLPLDKVIGLRLPGFATAIDEVSGRPVNCSTPEACDRRLLGLPRGQAAMLLLRGVREGRFQITFAHGLRLIALYSAKLFPTLGIWWNNGGYPDDDAGRRTECALEPIPGTWSSLARSQADGVYLEVGPGEHKMWEITWLISSSPAES